MAREYINYLDDALKNGMSKEEVTYLFEDIYAKSNTKKGKKVLRLFATGVGKAKKEVLAKQQENTNQIQYIKK